MPRTDIFVSSVIVAHNQAASIGAHIRRLAETLAQCVEDYEIVIVDNASNDATAAVLEVLSQELPNLQIICLSGHCGSDVAALAGIEQTIGDFVILTDPQHDDLDAIGNMIEAAYQGADIVLVPGPRRRSTVAYRFASRCFKWLFKRLHGFDLDADAPRFRLMGRRVINYIMQHETAYILHQILPLLAGFKRVTLSGSTRQRVSQNQRTLRDGVHQGIGLLLTVSALPMRVVSLICLLSAGLSVLYSTYVVIIYLFSAEVAQGWTTLSLQVSLMFFLLSIALWLMSEYMVRILDFAARKPPYHIAREFRSAQITHRQKLNLLAGESYARTGRNTGTNLHPIP